MECHVEEERFSCHRQALIGTAQTECCESVTQRWAVVSSALCSCTNAFTGTQRASDRESFK